MKKNWEAEDKKEKRQIRMFIHKSLTMQKHRKTAKLKRNERLGRLIQNRQSEAETYTKIIFSFSLVVGVFQ